MGISVFNFVGVSSPAAADSHKGFWGDSPVGDPTIPAPPTGTEGAQGDYDAIEADDASDWVNAAPVLDCYPFKVFRWYLPFSAGWPWKLTPLHIGLVPILGPGSQGFYLKIYNLLTSLWEIIDTSVVAPPEVYDTLTAAVTPATPYFDATNRYIWTAVENLFPHTALLSKRWDDYTELTVETLEGSRNIYRNVDGLIGGLVEPGCQI